MREHILQKETALIQAKYWIIKKCTLIKASIRCAPSFEHFYNTKITRMLRSKQKTLRQKIRWTEIAVVKQTKMII